MRDGGKGAGARRTSIILTYRATEAARRLR